MIPLIINMDFFPSELYHRPSGTPFEPQLHFLKEWKKQKYDIWPVCIEDPLSNILAINMSTSLLCSAVSTARPGPKPVSVLTLVEVARRRLHWV